jgi:hypothetical protein
MRRIIGGSFAVRAGCVAALWVVVQTRVVAADETAAGNATNDALTIGLFEGLRDGSLGVNAVGLGDGRMVVSLTNRTERRLQVVLPPSLLASGATGQFVGGGFGGGFPGGGFGGGMNGGVGGGFGGGMNGGMGGGLGGMNGGMGGRGAMGSNGLLPAPLGMAMVGRTIMGLTGNPVTWDRSSLSGWGTMGGGFGNGGGLGMNGGFGNGMNGGGVGLGGGRGFRSLPPSGPPSAALGAGQTSRLATTLLTLEGPASSPTLAMRPAGEPLRLADPETETSLSPRLRAVMRVLGDSQAPAGVAQLVVWRVEQNLDWELLAKASAAWANRSELLLAQQVESRLAAGPRPSPAEGILYYELSGDAAHRALIAELADQLKRGTILGLPAQTGIPKPPPGPAVACRVNIERGAVLVQVRVTDFSASWVSAGKFSIPLASAGGIPPSASQLAEEWAEGLLSRVVRVQLTHDAQASSEKPYRIRIENASPFVLHGLALAGPRPTTEPAPILPDLSLPPRRSITVPISSALIERSRLKGGIRAYAARLLAL